MTDYSDPDFRAARLKKRYQSEKRFRAYGMAAIITAGLVLVFLLGSIVYSSLPAFSHHHVRLDIICLKTMSPPTRPRTAIIWVLCALPCATISIK